MLTDRLRPVLISFSVVFLMIDIFRLALCAYFLTRKYPPDSFEEKNKSYSSILFNR